MPGTNDYIGLRIAQFGIRTTAPDAGLPATATSGYDTFTISGGRIAIIGLIGEVGTVVQTQTCNMKIIAKPTGGTAEDLCAVKDITAIEALGLLGITGLQTDALFGVASAFAPMCIRRQVVGIGTIGVYTSATNTGTMKWDLFWVPVDDSARVTLS